MKFGISSYVWVSPFSNSTLNQLKHAKEIGFDIFEIAVEHQDSFQAEQVKEYAQKVDIDIRICGAFGKRRDIGHPDEKVRAEGMEYIKSLIDVASILESPYVAGPMYAATGRVGVTGKEKEMQLCYVTENLKQLCDYAQQKKVCLAMEPLNRFETDFMNTVQQGMEIIDRTGASNLGFLLDTFHMNIEEKNMAHAIQLAGDRLYDFHACANDRGAPGEDHLNWSAIKEALQSIKYHGPVVIESFTTEITEIARAVSLWRPLANSQDELAENGLRFLKNNL